MNNIILFLKGFIGGVGNIIPGLSGSSLLVVLGIYEKCINAISNIFIDFKNSFKLLFFVGIGIIFGSVLFSKVILNLISIYPLATSIVFIFFIISTIPSLFLQATIKGYTDTSIIVFLVSFFIGLLFLIIGKLVVFENIQKTFLSLFFSGFLLSFSTIIPGISSTVLLNIFGFYDIYLNSIAYLEIYTLIRIGFGFCISTFFISKLVSYLFKKYYSYMYFSIIGFTIATVPSLFFVPIKFNLELLFGIIIGVFFLYFSIKIKDLY